MKKDDPKNMFTILDWIGTIYIAGAIFGLCLFPKIAATFEKMFNEFGGPIPYLTILVLKPWVPIVLALISMGIFSLQWFEPVRVDLKRRRAVLILAFLTASIAFGLCCIVLYLPIFQMARSVG